MYSDEATDSILSLLAPILADAEKWRKVKEIAGITEWECEERCKFAQACRDADFDLCDVCKDIVDALDGKEEGK